MSKGTNNSPTPLDKLDLKYLYYVVEIDCNVRFNSYVYRGTIFVRYRVRLIVPFGIQPYSQWYPFYFKSWFNNLTMWP